MGYIEGEGRTQATLFPVVLDDFVPADHLCRVIDAFVEKLAMSELGFERARASLRDGQVPYLRTSACADAWVVRCKSGNWARYNGI
jgi:hypothetical protein